MNDHTNNQHNTHGTNINVSGSNSGGINIHPPSGEPQQKFDERSRRWLRVTERALALVSSGLTIGVALSGWKVLQPVVTQLLQFFGWGPDTNISPTTNTWLYTFLFLFVALVVSGSLWGIAHRRTISMSRFSFLPTLAGATDPNGVRRLALVRLKGSCVECGGKLRFQSIVPRQDENEQTGKTPGRAAQRRNAAVCSRNPRDHFFYIDPTALEFDED